jgi:uncharacterized membrane protein
LRLPHLQRYILTGLLTVFPLWLTWIVFEFVLRQLGKLSAPWVDAILRRSADAVPFFGVLFDLEWLRFGLAVLVTLAGLYALGALANRVIGKRLLGVVDRLIERIPLVQSIYGGTKKLLAVLQTRPEGTQRVVLIDFPHRDMKAVGFVTRTVRDAGTGREIAMVYVPTTPNPTSGYLEVVPVERLVPTDWTVDQAMALIISGGAVAPDSVRFDRPPPSPADPQA